MTADTEKAKAVLEALRGVCKEFNVELGACGDCGSMWIDDLDTGAQIASYITSVMPEGSDWDDSYTTPSTIPDLKDALDGVPESIRPPS